MSTRRADTGRDRDPSGRARNARPRDATGRPLPRGAEGVPRVPDDAPPLPPREALRAAQELIDGDRPFHAHEILEGVWKAAPEPEREFWRSLAQLAVGLAHRQRGNAKGAVALLRRGAAGLAPYAADPPHAVPVVDVVAQADALASALEAEDVDADADATIRLVAAT